MQTEKLKVGSLIPYENNAKLHPQEQIEQIKTSIREFGFNDPIAVDENNIIIEGHGRWMALKQMGVDEVECIRLTHLTDEQKKAYILVHNKLTMNTGFDFNILDSELAKIESIDMAEFNFETMDFNEDEFDTEFTLNSSEVPLQRTITLTLSAEQYAIVTKAIERVQEEEYEESPIANKDGNAIYQIFREWQELCRQKY